MFESPVQRLDRSPHGFRAGVSGRPVNPPGRGVISSSGLLLISAHSDVYCAQILIRLILFKSNCNFGRTPGGSQVVPRWAGRTNATNSSLQNQLDTDDWNPLVWSFKQCTLHNCIRPPKQKSAQKRHCRHFLSEILNLKIAFVFGLGSVLIRLPAS